LQPEIFSENDPYRDNFMRRIDCTHFRSITTLPWPLIQGKIRKMTTSSSKTQFFP
jgi:hypothetical protein